MSADKVSWIMSSGLRLRGRTNRRVLGDCDVAYLAMERHLILSGLRSPARYCANLRAARREGVQRRRRRGGGGTARAQYRKRGLAVTGAPVPAPIAAFSETALLRRLRQGINRAMKEEAKSQPIVFVVDDDASVRNALANLFRSVDLRTQVFGSADEFLSSKPPDAASCLVLDIRLPGLSGLDFQIELAKANVHIPIIFMTGHGDIPMTVRAMKAGAVDFLSKPFRDQDMLDAVSAAIERDRKRRQSESATADIRTLYETLTSREREVMAFVTTGLMNKQVAAEMGLSEITVKIHRGHVMKKMGARSLADLVRMAEALGVHPRRS
jgi:FixJ family two-component response regulator